MRCLFLDLASHHGLLACTEDDVIAASEPVDHRIGDHELIPLFEKTLQAAGWKAGDLTHCACVIGPGGFMSLRVAVAFANTLIHQRRIPGAGIHLSDLYAARGPYLPSSLSISQTSIPQPLPLSIAQTSIPPTPFLPGRKGEVAPSIAMLPLSSGEGVRGERLSLKKGLRGEVGKNKSEKGGEDFLWLHSTKKHELFVRGFGSYASLWPEAAHVTVEDFLLRAKEIRESSLRWCGELIPEHEALFQEKKLQPVTLCPLADVLPAFLGKQTFTEKLLEPWYGRGW